MTALRWLEMAGRQSSIRNLKDAAVQVQGAGTEGERSRYHMRSGVLHQTRKAKKTRNPGEMTMFFYDTLSTGVRPW